MLMHTVSEQDQRQELSEKIIRELSLTFETQAKRHTDQISRLTTQ